MNGLTWSEVILGILLPLILGAYVYAWVSNGRLWAGIEKLRGEFQAGLKEVKENGLRHLEERIERLEDRAE